MVSAWGLPGLTPCAPTPSGPYQWDGLEEASVILLGEDSSLRQWTMVVNLAV